MKIPGPPQVGACRCGAVRFRIDAAPLFTAICHCRGCQRMTGGAFSTTVSVPTDGFVITAGKPVIGGMHAADAHHHHCDDCKSWVYTTFGQDMGFVNVRATMLDDASWFEPFVETYTSAALPWAIANAPHAYAAFPPMEAYQELLGAFAAAVSVPALRP